MVNRLRLAALVAALAANAVWAADAGPPGPPDRGPMPAPSKIYAVKLELEASANLYQKWPSGGLTWHHGTGFIEPFGAGEYYCGENFPEAKQHPLSDWLKGMMLQFTGRADALFCIYTVKDGSFYVYDSVAGEREHLDDGSRNQMINVVVGGTGAYEGATGIWLGLTEGRGEPKEVVPGRRLPAVLLKVMDGYVKLPLKTAAK